MSRFQNRARLGIGLILSAWLACAGVTARGQEASPEAALKEKGLRGAGAFYVLPGEGELARKLNAVRGLYKELSAALAKQKALEIAAEDSKRLVAEYSQQRRALRERLPAASSTQEHNQIVNTMNELGDRINQLIEAGDNARAIKQASTAAAARREAYVQALLDTRQLIDQTDKTYTNLAADDAVKAALDTINTARKSPVRLGPTRTYASNIKLFEKFEAAIKSETIPLREENGVYLIDTVLNGKLSKAMIFDTGASLISLPAEVADQLGLKPTAATPTIRLELANGSTIDGKLMRLDSVRVGKFEVENVDCAVLSADASKAPPLLGGSFLRNFAYQIKPERSQLTLSRVSTPADPDNAQPAAKPRTGRAGKAAKKKR